MVVPTLHPYQEYAKDYIKARKFSGLFLDMGLGKATDDDEPILTTKGYKRVGDVRVGDYLYDRLGQPTKVTARYPHKNQRAFRITLKDGRNYICNDEHLTPYYGYSDAKKIQVKPLKEMLDDYKQETSQGTTKYKYRLPQNEAVDLNAKEHIIDPYALGVLIGGGSIDTNGVVKVSASDPEVIDKLSDKTDLTFERQPNTKNIWIMNESKEKAVIQKELSRLNLEDLSRHIPSEYLFDSIENRKQLITGLFDSAGYVHVSNSGSTHYKFSTMQPSFARQIQKLSQSLGFGVMLQDYIYGGIRKEIAIRIYTPEIIVSTEKQLNKLNSGEYRSNYHRMIPIVDITEVEPRDMTCFTVDNAEHLYLLDDFVVTHNTLITLTALSELGQEGMLNGHILVIAPKKIAMNTWPAEIEKWDHTKNAKYTVLTGLPKKKRDEELKQVFKRPAQFYFINPELVAKLVETFGEYWPFKTVIIDEVQTFKSYNAQRFKALKKVRPYIERIVALTGTPAPNSLMDLWPQITLLDGGRRLGRNITTYRETFFNPGRRTPQGYPYEWLLKAGAEDEIYDRIDDIVISMKAKDYLDMPDITYNNIEVSMSKNERKVYQQMKKEHVLPLVDGNKITSANAATLSAHLLQLANGAIYMDPDTRDVAELHSQKIDALEQVVDSSQGSPILVFYWFQHDMKRIKERFGDDVTVFDGSPEHIRMWNNKEIPVMLAHPASAGYGLNLQEGGHIIVWFSLPNGNLGVYLQSNARLYRQGQTEPVIVHHIVTKGTVDIGMLRSLDDKEKNQDRLMDSVKAELQDVSDDDLTIE